MTEARSEISPDRARELLARERARIEGALADLRRGRQGDLDEIDTSTDPADDERVLEAVGVDDALGRQLLDELEAIERAERRVEDGTYGLSIESGEPIPAGRLEAVPWAERTAGEQEAWEKPRGR